MQHHCLFLLNILFEKQLGQVNALEYFWSHVNLIRCSFSWHFRYPIMFLFSCKNFYNLHSFQHSTAAQKRYKLYFLSEQMHAEVHKHKTLKAKTLPMQSHYFHV